MKFKNLFNNFKVQIVLLAVLLSVFGLFLRDANPYTLDAKLGIEFVGGVRIPVTLEKSVDAATMDSAVDTLKTRINTFGLSQAVVRSVGDRDIIVEIPQADERVISSVKQILQEQGRFEAIVDGKQAVIGEDVIAVGGPNGELTPSTTRSAQWSLSFSVTKAGAQRFSQAARNKAKYPVYMFLDRPENATLILSRSELGTVSDQTARDALAKEGDDIQLLFVEDIEASAGRNINSNATSAASTVLATQKVILSNETAARSGGAIAALLQTYGYTSDANSSRRVIYKSRAEIGPVSQGATAGLSEWKAIGLLSAPLLSEGLANGLESQFYSISGASPGATQQEQETYAIAQIKQLKSVISGGKLPVSALVGSSYSVEPSLGSQFLQYSLIATIIGIIVVALLVVLRYGNVMLSIPIIITNVFEIIILTAVIGTFGTIDLAAMAGIISLIGTGVDDQLIVTDEMLRRRQRGEHVLMEKHEAKEKIAAAFRIIFTTAGVAVVTMIPLLLSGIVEISGFALATIIGIGVGVLITRPAFGVFIEAMFEKES